uniref:Response regulatory domain-containing protein n=1 Tax=Streptomyces avermitilis TaxID=33903 RepID=A0A499VH15_STRAX|nr:hypothetical protein SAVMC3_64040 [Streptomyces avermitilis]
MTPPTVPPTPVRVLLADDQTLVRAAFAMLVESATDMEVVGQAGTGREAVRLARSERADVVVMDLRMPDLDGIDATRLIAADDDLAGVRVLVLTTYDTDEYIVEALRAGASGFLVKDTKPAELLDAIRTVAAGEALLSPGPTARLIARLLRTPVPPRRRPSAPSASPAGSAKCSRWSRAGSTTRRSPSRWDSARSPRRPMSAASWASWAPGTGPSW